MIKLFHHPIETYIMNTGIKNKVLIGLIAMLLIANAITIIMFWTSRVKHPPPSKGTAQEFLVQELKLDTKQQKQFELLRSEHRNASEKLRQQIREAKESFFDLLKQPTVSDSTKQSAAKAVSVYTEELDLVTFNHFSKIRLMCTPEQQIKFDEIVHQVTNMISQPRLPMPPGNRLHGLPTDEPAGDRPPPPPEK